MRNIFGKLESDLFFIKLLIALIFGFLSIAISKLWFYLGYLERGFYAFGAEILLSAITIIFFFWLARKIFKYLDSIFD